MVAPTRSKTPKAPVAKPAASAKTPVPTAKVVDAPEEAARPVGKPAVKPAAPKPVATAPVPKVVAEKPLPFVIEPTAAPVAPVPPIAPAPLVAEAASTPVDAPVELSVPPQPVADAPLVAAAETASAEEPTRNVLEGHPVMSEAIETTKKFAEDAKARLQSAVAEFNDKAKTALEKSSKVIEELNDIAKGNIEAVVESSKIAAKGAESIGQSAAEYGRASFEKSSATLKSFASVKSPTEFFQLQSQLFTSSFDSLASETAKASETFLKLAGDIAQPLSSRVAVVSDKIKTLAA